MIKQKTALLIINVGTPDAPTTAAVRRYLFRFLNDRRVIDLPLIFQKLLVNAVIVPFRAPKSTKLYKKLWNEKGSPLLYHSEALRDKLAISLGNDYEVFLGMRYGNPSLKKALKEIEKRQFDKLIVFPLFPQYAMSTSGTAFSAVLNVIRKWKVIPDTDLIGQFYNNAGFISLFADKLRQANLSEYEHVIFTYHGLPYRHIHKIHKEHSCEKCICTDEMPSYGHFCYRATCYETTRRIVKELQLDEDKYSVSFQSRLSKNWLNPFTDELVKQKAEEGVKKLIVTSPSFVADSLETTIELGQEYKELFYENGGKDYKLVTSLNDNDDWVNVLTEIIK